MHEFPNWVQLLGRLVLALLISAPLLGFLYFLFGKPGLVGGIVVASPLVAKLTARQLIELTHEGFSWLWHQPLKAWEGSYYAFDNVQVRVYEVDGALWFTIKDVLSAVGMRNVPRAFASTHGPQLRRIQGTMLDAVAASGIAPLMAYARDPRGGRFVLWAQREVVAPWERKVGIAKTRFGA